jgi:hypothetical protein
MKRLIAAVAAAFLVVAWVGCGGSDSEPLTKAEYAKQAKVICHKGEQEKEEAINTAILRYQEGEKNATPDLQKKAVLEVLTPFEKTTEKLAELEPPESSQKQVETMVRTRETAAKEMRANPEKALGDSTPILKAVKLTEGLGLGKCDF